MTTNGLGDGMRRLAVVGVPWSAEELKVAVQSAYRESARVLLVDTPEALANVSPMGNCEVISVVNNSPQLIAEALVSRSPDQVVAITELDMVRAAETRELLGLPGTSSHTERTVIDKYRTRVVLGAAGLSAVDCFRCSASELLTRLRCTRLPAVVKPRSFTGSHGVYLLSEDESLETAVSHVLAAYDLPTARDYGRDDILVEALIPGPEISAEAIVVEGVLRLLALTDKVTLEPPSFFEVGHIMPSRLSFGKYKIVSEYLQSVTTALGIWTSPIHAELKLSDDGVALIELHTRFGGGTIVRLLAESMKLDAYQLFFAAALDASLPGRAHEERPETCRGVAFFGARPDLTFSWPSFDFPFPGAVTAIDFDAQRTPQVREHEGIRLQHWRAGTVRFKATRREVEANIDFVKSIVQRMY